jgi:hypothetical protein
VRWPGWRKPAPRWWSLTKCLTFLAFGHRLSLPGLDHWIASRLMNMGDDLAGLIERHRNIDIAGIGRRVLNDSRYEIIWRGGGYLMVGNAP